MKKFLFNILKNRKERFPKLLSIELSSVCNADCIMCPHGEMDRRKQNMSLELLQKIVDYCVGKPLQKINLFWFGDFLCHNKVIDCFRIERKTLPKVKLNLSTNAGLLSENRSETIINMVPTENEIKDFVDYWTPLVDKVDVNKYNTWLGTQDDLNVVDNYTESKAGNFNFACLHPWDELVISSYGTAGLCCLDYDLKAPVGDIHKESIEEIWHSRTLKGYRDKMLKLDYDSIDVCKNCNPYIFQENKLWTRLQQ